MTPLELSNKAQDLKDQFDCMKLSESEFKELVNDLIIVQAMNNDALHLEENIKYHDIIVGVINIASALT
tara:strand:- start:1074 stop:1280 length:207 start_codon:yes stop_codon:yes gene_type:complete